MGPFQNVLRKAEMASYGPDDSEDAVKVYTTDTIVDHPGAKIVYKGLVTIGKRETYPTFDDPTPTDALRRSVFPSVGDPSRHCPSYPRGQGEGQETRRQCHRRYE